MTTEEMIELLTSLCTYVSAYDLPPIGATATPAPLQGGAQVIKFEYVEPTLLNGIDRALADLQGQLGDMRELAVNAGAPLARNLLADALKVAGVVPPADLVDCAGRVADLMPALSRALRDVLGILTRDGGFRTHDDQQTMRRAARVLTGDQS